MKIIPLILICSGTIWGLYNLSRYFHWSLPFLKVSISMGKWSFGNSQPANRDTDIVEAPKERAPVAEPSLLGPSRSILRKDVVSAVPSKPVAAVVNAQVPVAAGSGSEVLVTDEPEIDVPQGAHEFNARPDGESELIPADSSPELVDGEQSGEQAESVIEMDEVDDEVDTAHDSGYVSLNNQMGDAFGYPEGESQTEPDESFEELELGEGAFESDALEDVLDNESAKPLDQYMSQYGTVHIALQAIGKAVQRRRRRQDVTEMVREFSQVIDHYRLRNDSNVHSMAANAFSVIKESDEKADYVKYYFDIIKACRDGEDAEFEEDQEPEGN